MIVEQPKNQIIYDWLSFTTKIHSLSEVLDLLDFRHDTVTFKQQDKGRYFYRKSLYYEGISIYYDGFSKQNGDMGICVEMSGKGLRNWEEYSSANYEKIFDLILENYDLDADKRKMNLTRLDVAYDDFEGLLDGELLFRESDEGNYCSRFNHLDLHKDKDGRKLSGLTIGHGSKSSNVYIRIYDKRTQQHVEDLITHWVRCELQLRHENAYGFICLKNSIEKNYFDVLNNYLRYIVPSSEDSNLRRAQIAPYWLAFIQSAESRRIFNKPKNDYKLENLLNYVDNQLSGAITTYIDILGVNNFLKNIHHSRSGKQLNPKYKSLKEQADANGSAILAYLKEHNLE